MAWKDIAQQMGISDTRVMQLFDRAILKIKAELKKPEFADLRDDFEDYLYRLDETKPISRR